MKEQKWLAQKEEWKQKECEKKKARKKNRKKLIREGVIVDDKKANKKRKLHEIEFHGTVVIDVAFEDQMTPKELKSLVTQLLFSYGANNKADKPVRLYITGMGPQLKEQLKKMEGFPNWKIFVEQRDYLEVFPKETLVYLTSESDNVMTTMENDKVYVIGGIVDHNRLKGITFKKSK